MLGTGSPAENELEAVCRCVSILKDWMFNVCICIYDAYT